MELFLFRIRHSETIFSESCSYLERYEYLVEDYSAHYAKADDARMVFMILAQVSLYQKIVDLCDATYQGNFY